MTARLLPLKPDFKQIQSPIPQAKAFRWGYLTVIVEKHSTGWHISISHPHRYPSWEEIKAARYTLCPENITMAMYLPPPDEFVNLHPNCFHLYQVEDDKAELIAGRIHT